MALQQFFTVFYEYRPNDFYVTGESYAGKYIPSIAYTIHKAGAKANINLKGIAIGDGWCDPETMMKYGDFLYQVGMVDEKEATVFHAEENKITDLIRNKQYYEAFEVLDSLIGGDLINTTSYYTNVTGSSFYFNILYSQQPEEFNYYNSYLALPETRNAIHVGNLTYNDGKNVEKKLLNDFIQSVKPWISVLMDNYKVLIYSGQLDIIVAAPLTESFLKSVDWRYANEYRSAEKFIWKVSSEDKEVAGYVRQVHNFAQVIVRNAGHILPYDQPRASFDMIRRFVNNEGFKN